MDESYKLAVEVLMPLNHNRYKDYFIQFGTLNVGLILAAGEHEAVRPFVPWVGGAINLIWYYVQIKIAEDITALHSKLKAFEQCATRATDEDQKINVKVTECGSGLWGASRLMVVVPLILFVLHVVVRW